MKRSWKYGYTREEILGQYISVIRPVKISLVLGNQIKTATFAGGWSGKVVNSGKTAVSFRLNYGLSSENDGGKIIAMVGIARDITEQKQVEDALRKSEERMRAVVEGTPQLFFYTQVWSKYHLCISDR